MALVEAKHGNLDIGTDAEYLECAELVEGAFNDEQAAEAQGAA